MIKRKIAYYHQCGGCNQITDITPINPWTKYYKIQDTICNGKECWNQIMYIVWLYEPSVIPQATHQAML